MLAECGLSPLLFFKREEETKPRSQIIKSQTDAVPLQPGGERDLKAVATQIRMIANTMKQSHTQHTWDKMKNLTASRTLQNSALFILLVHTTGCVSTLPDVMPYTEATVELRTAFVSSGGTGVQELRALKVNDAEKQAELDADALRLEDAWEARIKVIDATVVYSQALENIVSSGEGGRESVGKVADALTGLAAAAGISNPASGAATVLVDASKLIYEQIAKARAAKSLAASLDDTQPAVDKLVEIASKDLSDLDILVEASLTERRSVLIEQSSDLLGYRNALLTERGDLYNDWGAAAGEERAAVESRLSSVNEQILATNEWFLPLNDQLRALESRIRASKQLFRAMGEGLTAWGEAHAELAQAVEEERTKGPSAAAIIASAKEIKLLVERVQDQ